MKNYEILLIRHGNPLGTYPNVGKVYTSPHADCVESAQMIYYKQTLHTAVNLRGRDSDETDGEFAVRCVAGLSQLFADMTRSEVGKAALVTHDETIVTLMAGCSLPEGKPTDFILQPGEGWLVKMSAFLWQKAYKFETVGKLSNG
jgi:broad specificity phosphatase PhoE